MSLSESRANSAATNAAFHMRTAVEHRPIPEQVQAYAEAQAAGRYAMRPNIEVLGTCGHRLDVLGPTSPTTERQIAKIEAGKFRRRCHHCPKD